MERFLFWILDRWRLANASEKEILLGYGAGHTELCFIASKIKQSVTAFEDERLSLLGDSFSIFWFVIAAAGLCRRFISSVSYRHLPNRMGMAPGMVLPLSRQAPLSRNLCHGLFKHSHSANPKVLNQLYCLGQIIPGLMSGFQLVKFLPRSLLFNKVFKLLRGSGNQSSG